MMEKEFQKITSAKNLKEFLEAERKTLEYIYNSGWRQYRHKYLLLSCLSKSIKKVIKNLDGKGASHHYSLLMKAEKEKVLAFEKWERHVEAVVNKKEGTEKILRSALRHGNAATRFFIAGNFFREAAEVKEHQSWYLFDSAWLRSSFKVLEAKTRIKAAELWIKAGNKQNAARNFILAGLAYYARKEPKKSMIYFVRAAKLSEESDLSMVAAAAYKYLAKAYVTLSQIDVVNDFFWKKKAKNALLSAKKILMEMGFDEVANRLDKILVN